MLSGSGQRFGGFGIFWYNESMTAAEKGFYSKEEETVFPARRAVVLDLLDRLLGDFKRQVSGEKGKALLLKDGYTPFGLRVETVYSEQMREEYQNRRDFRRACRAGGVGEMRMFFVEAGAGEGEYLLLTTNGDGSLGEWGKRVVTCFDGETFPVRVEDAGGVEYYTRVLGTLD